MKMKVQAQHLQYGDVLGSGEIIKNVIVNSLYLPKGKVTVITNYRSCHWGKYTQINIDRPDKNV